MLKTINTSFVWHCWLHIVFIHQLHHKIFTELGVIQKETRIWAVIWNWGWRSAVWTSAEWHEPPLFTAQYLKPACLRFDWVFWVIKSCCWPDDEEPDAYIVSREESVHLYKARPQLDTRETLSNTPGTICYYYFFRHSSYHFNGSHLIPGQPCHVTGNSSFWRLHFLFLWW